MQIRTIRGTELEPDLVRAWTAFTDANPELKSPYFHPQFTRLAAAVRPNVEIAVLEDGGKIAGFFPFERLSSGIGEPAGSYFSDFHGLIAPRDLEIDPAQLLRGCNLAAWDFTHQLASQSAFKTGMQSLLPSPQMDLTGGYDAYRARKEAQGSHMFDRAAYKIRHLEREVGPLRYCTHTAEQAVFDLLLDWKAAQHVRSGHPDIFKLGWTRGLLQAIQDTQTQDFAGLLSTLHAGDKLIAIHFGMRSRTVWHQWFPAFDRAYHKHSPGIILTLKMAEAATAMGIDTMDLGVGQHEDKDRMATGEVMIARGSVELLTWRSVRRRIGRKVEKLGLRDPVRKLARSLRASLKGFLF